LKRGKVCIEFVLAASCATKMMALLLWKTHSGIEELQQKRDEIKRTVELKKAIGASLLVV
jgi:hypothetical protein